MNIADPPATFHNYLDEFLAAVRVRLFFSPSESPD